MPLCLNTSGKADVYASLFRRVPLLVKALYEYSAYAPMSYFLSACFIPAETSVTENMLLSFSGETSLTERSWFTDAFTDVLPKERL